MQGNEELKKRQILSAQIDLSKFNKGDFIKATEEEKKHYRINTRLNLPKEVKNHDQ